MNICPAVEVVGLHKFYGKNEALKGLSFSLPMGKILGIIGANGAGKSTLFDILTTLDRNFTGRVLMLGLSSLGNYRQIRNFIGYVPGNFSIYPDLTVAENISFFAKMYNSPETSYRDHPFWDSLSAFANKRAAVLSGGMKQKLAIICAMVHSPEILFLDEPTTGIDPDSRVEIWKELQKLRERGMTIVSSTHYYEEFDYMDYLLVLHEGRQLCFTSEKSTNYEKFLAECLIQS